MKSYNLGKFGISYPIQWDRMFVPIVVIIYMMTVEKVQSKRLTIFENFHQGITIPNFFGFALYWLPLDHQDSSNMPWYSLHGQYLCNIIYGMDYRILWNPPTCLNPPPHFLKHYVRWDPLEHFLSNTGASWWELQHTLPSSKVQQSHFKHQNHCPSQHICTKKREACIYKSWVQLFFQTPSEALGPSIPVYPSPIQYFPSAKIEVIPQNIVWRLFSKGCGFRPTHMNPGGGLLYHSIMFFSSTFFQYGLNSSAIFLFHDSSICLIWNNPSLYYNYLPVYLREANT